MRVVDLLNFFDVQVLSRCIPLPLSRGIVTERSHSSVVDMAPLDFELTTFQ